MASKILSVKDVAAMLKATEASVGRYCRSGELPAVRLGGKWRISEDALNKFFNQPKPVQRGNA